MTAVRSLDFSVPGCPIGKDRPRFARAGKSLRVYTPTETKRYERAVALLARSALARAEKLCGPVSVRIDAWYPIPESWSRRKRASALDDGVMPTTKPDIDNVAKVVLDGLNRVAFADDAQIVDLQCRKRYGETPSVRVRVAEVATQEISE